MPVPYCHMCESDPNEKSRYGDAGLEGGDYCPVCFRPYCRFHGGIVRWRWRETGQVDSGHVCRECKKTYRHRSWDPVHRDWIS